MAPQRPDTSSAALPSPGAESSVSGKREAPSPAEGEHGPDSGQGEDGAAARKKKKVVVPSSRGVANLTPEQLAKKRANDREAQRAIRERTKTQIETLERRIQDLTSQQPYQELQSVIRAKEAVERENADMKRRLSSIVAMLQPMIGLGGDAKVLLGADPSMISPAQSYTPPAPNPHAASVPSASSPGSVASPMSSGPTHRPSAEPPTPGFGQHRPGGHQTHLEIGPERLGLDFVLKPGQRVATVQSGANGAQDSARYHHMPMKHDWTGVTNDQVMRARPNSWESPASVQFGSQAASQNVDAGHASPIMNCSPTCPLDTLLLDFLSERRQLAAEGAPQQEVVGPRYPSVSSLLNPANSAYSHPLSKVFTDILSTFPDISSLPERVAVLYVMFLVMRWQISPSQENYERLPDWVRPLPSQLHIKHPAWLDSLPFPRMRDRICRNYTPNLYLFDNFFVPYTTTLWLSWPYEDTDVLLRSPDTDELLINPVFERHLRNIDNWKLGDRFAKAFPSLDDTYNLDTRTSR